MRANDISCAELLEGALAAVELYDDPLNVFAELLDGPAPASIGWFRSEMHRPSPC